MNLKKSDTTKPYGPGVLLDWVLELDGGKSNRLIDFQRSEIPSDVKPATKFIIHNKDKIWELINKARNDVADPDDEPDVRELAAFLANNSGELGIQNNNAEAWERLLLNLRATTNLMENSPPSLVDLKALYQDLVRRNEMD